MNKLGSSSYHAGDCGGTYGDQHALATVPQAKQPSLLRRAGQAVKRVGVGALKLGAAAAGAYGAYRLGKHLKSKYGSKGVGTALARIGTKSGAVERLKSAASGVASRIRSGAPSVISSARDKASKFVKNARAFAGGAAKALQAGSAASKGAKKPRAPRAASTGPKVGKPRVQRAPKVQVIGKQKPTTGEAVKRARRAAGA